ncbi:STAS domain-containing protein [Kitasatospora sp. NBC_00240]|uniref:STAS domain-containing protein n=1 Tax=Kitasatospora sp. NBC_00240 TaxID=2903567 RepID=UPI00225BD199|nr:STAS domain-containing protein [Kitasatospora sp. NBC_00240]MCX5215967.1 STAS domain-containing protein [Kitasatospora sp. NBC_00240]
MTTHPPLFSVRLRPGGGDPVLEAVGELDQYTGGLLDAAVDGALDAVPAAGELVLDMAGVRFCDSGGLNAVLRAHLRAQAAGAVLHVVAPTARVVALFGRTGVNRVLRVSPHAPASTGPGQVHPSC